MNTQTSLQDTIILLCRSSDTLKLADHLSSIGIPSYAPRISIRMRMPRTKRFATIIKPLMPSFVFARARGIPLPSPSHDIPKFRPLIINTLPVYISEDDLSGVREIEVEMNTIKLRSSKYRRLYTGEIVKIPFGPFLGKSAVVLGFDRGFWDLELENNGMIIKLSAFLFKVAKS